jgi:tetratricopeptide (TPR) repeat protein
MIFIRPEEVQADLKRAIERQYYEGGGETLTEILRATAPACREYWVEAACELHRRCKFYEALDCWREAEKFFTAGNTVFEFCYQDMVMTLINAFYQTRDSNFLHEALDACERLLMLDAKRDTNSYSYIYDILQDFGFTLEQLLGLIERVLDQGVKFRGLRVDNFGLYGRQEILSYADIAECHLCLNRPQDALRVWSRAIQMNEVKSQEILRGVISALNAFLAERAGD